jgi:phosphatidylserine decarboxylase
MTDTPLRWHHRLYVGLQYALPHHLLARPVYGLARVRWGPLKDLLIRVFARHFGVDREEAKSPDPSAYPHFNAFFTRALRPGARPIAGPEGAVVSPADGVLSQIGGIGDGRIFQAKGHDYALLELLGGDAERAAPFRGGSFATVYLAPRDYHRVHMPLAGRLREMVHVPGRLFSVNPITTRSVPRLFARNERVLCLFDGPAGPMAVVLVGAIFVGGIETVWAGEITPRRALHPAVRYDTDAVRLDTGAELGRFNMGSTVILLFPPGQVRWDSALTPGTRVRMGGRLGEVIGHSPAPPAATAL